MNIINYLVENWQAIGSALALIMGASRIIVKLTPTPKDDSIVEFLVNIFKHLGLHIDSEQKK